MLIAKKKPAIGLNHFNLIARLGTPLYPAVFKKFLSKPLFQGWKN